MLIKSENIPVQVHNDAATASKAVARKIAELIVERQKQGKPAVLGLATGSTPTGVYAELIRLHEQAPPTILEADGARWPLLSYDALALKTGGDMFLEWWPKYARRAPFSPEAVAEWNALWEPIRQRAIILMPSNT